MNKWYGDTKETYYEYCVWNYKKTVPSSQRKNNYWHCSQSIIQKVAVKQWPNAKHILTQWYFPEILVLQKTQCVHATFLRATVDH